MDKDWFKKLFINEAKPALERHSDKAVFVTSDNKVFSVQEAV